MCGTMRIGIPLLISMAFLAFSVNGVAGFAATLSDGPFHLEYDAQDADVAKHSIEILQTALRGFEARLTPGQEPIMVIIAATHQEFQEYTTQFGETRVTGLAYPEKGLIVIKPPRLLESDADFQGVLRHELVHVLLERNVDVSNMPRWLNEGIAMALSKERRWSSALHVGQMYAGGRLLTYPELTRVLSAGGREMEFGDAYAQSLSMTRFLTNALGKNGFWEFVYSLNRMPFSEALETQTSLTEDSLMGLWRKSLRKIAVSTTIASGMTVFQLMAVLCIVGYVRQRRRVRRILEQWALDESETAEDLGEEYSDAPYVWEYDDDSW